MATLISTKGLASQTTEGPVRIATVEETTAGTREDLAVSPAGVKAQLAALLDGAPQALDTLNELAAAIGDDENYFSTIQALTDDFEDRISDLESGTSVLPNTASQAELDDTQAGAGLNTDGTYTADGSSNYISGATSLKNADSLLDAQIKANADAIISMGAGNIQDLQDEVDDNQSSVGLNSAGTLPAYANNNNFAANASICLL